MLINIITIPILKHSTSCKHKADDNVAKCIQD